MSISAVNSSLPASPALSNHNSENLALRQQVLQLILACEPYHRWKHTGNGRLGLGEYRPAGEENPGLKLDALGLYDFREGRGVKSLWQVGAEVGIRECLERSERWAAAEKKKQAKRAKQDEQRARAEKNLQDRLDCDRPECDGNLGWWLDSQFPIIENYFERVRGIPLSQVFPERWQRARFYHEVLQCAVQQYSLTEKTVNTAGSGGAEEKTREVCELVIPMRGVGGDLVQLSKIEINKDGQKLQKRFKFSQENDRAIVFGALPSEAVEYVVLEGIENALSLWAGTWSAETGVGAATRYIVTCGTAGFSAIEEFIEEAREANARVVLICDPDKEDTSLKKSETLGEKVARYVPSGEAWEKIDANRALQRGELGEWLAELRAVSHEEVLELLKQDEEHDLILAEFDAHEFHKVKNPASDSGAAKFFVERFGNKVRLSEDARWWAWTGKVWSCDFAESRIRKWIAALAPIYERAARAVVGMDENAIATRKGLYAFAVALAGTRRQSTVLKCLEGATEFHCRVEDFDAEPHLLNCQNGVLNLLTRELTAHGAKTTAAMMCSKICRARWKPEAQCPVFDTFAQDIVCGDLDLLAYKFRQWGYLLSGYTKEKTIFFHWGESGDNGKSTEAELLQWLMGDYSREISTDTYLENRYSNESAYELAYLPGIRLAVSGETSESKPWDETLVKKFTGGGDKIVARAIKCAPFNFQPRFKPLIHGNRKPPIKTADAAFIARLHLIPYNFKAEGEKKDEFLFQKLQLETEGILRRFVDGFIEWRAVGLRPPAIILHAVEEYAEEAFDDLRDFLRERCVVGEQEEIAFWKFYEDYCKFCKEHSRRPRSKTAFGIFLNSQNISTSKGANGVRIRSGVRLKTDLEMSEAAVSNLPPTSGNLDKDDDDDGLF